MWASAALSILGRLLGWVPAIAAWVLARRTADAARLEIAIKVKDAQATIAARAALRPSELLDRLRRDGTI